MLHFFWQYLIKPSLLVLALISLCKGAFLLIQLPHIQEESWGTIAQVFTNSFTLDLAVLSYILVLPTLIFISQLFAKNPIRLRKFTVIYFSIVCILTIAINLIDIHLFSFWSSKTSAKALSYLNTPQMVISSAGRLNVLLFVCAMIVIGMITFIIFNKLIRKSKVPKIHVVWKLLIPLPLFTILILGFRGGFREIPINQSEAYFSSNHVLNVAGVNSLWNFGNVLFQNTNNLQDNPYKTMNEEQAALVSKQLFQVSQEEDIAFLNTNTPNIIYIAMEGVNANCIKEYNATNNYMPNVSDILKEAYSYKEMYASGMRTDQGLVALLSGFPALPLHTIGAQPEKFQQLPSLSLALKDKGYKNTFFFGGEPEFGSFKAFLVHNGFEKIYSLFDFDKDKRTQDLGVPDAALFNRFLEDMQTPEAPFFSLILTQTTHEPFDMPFNKQVNKDATKYINTVQYLDSVIGKWYKACHQLPWFENTLFILSSDHAHTFPDEYWYTDKERYHIPFILFGPALKEEYKGLENNQLVNQVDIPLSLSKQLELKEQNFEFSKNIFDPNSPQFSSYIHIHGHNWIDLDGQCSVNYELHNDFNNTDNLDSCTIKNAAYFQYIFEQYMSY